MNEEIYKEFLNRFPANKRSLIMNQFCSAFREGYTDVESLLERVKSDTVKRCSNHHISVSDIEIQRDLFNLCCDSEIAVKMAEYVIWWEKLDWKTKDEIKRARQSGYVSQHMAAQPPSEKQLKYLEGLKCKVIPQTKLEASQLIDECLKK